MAVTSGVSRQGHGGYIRYIQGARAVQEHDGLPAVTVLARELNKDNGAAWIPSFLILPLPVNSIQLCRNLENRWAGGRIFCAIGLCGGRRMLKLLPLCLQPFMEEAIAYRSYLPAKPAKEEGLQLHDPGHSRVCRSSNSVHTTRSVPPDFAHSGLIPIPGPSQALHDCGESGIVFRLTAIQTMPHSWDSRILDED